MSETDGASTDAASRSHERVFRLQHRSHTHSLFLKPNCGSHQDACDICFHVMMPKSLWPGAPPVLATNSSHQALQGRSKHQGDEHTLTATAASAPSAETDELLLASYGVSPCNRSP